MSKSSLGTPPNTWKPPKCQKIKNCRKASTETVLFDFVFSFFFVFCGSGGPGGVVGAAGVVLVMIVVKGGGAGNLGGLGRLVWWFGGMCSAICVCVMVSGNPVT